MEIIFLFGNFLSWPADATFFINMIESSQFGVALPVIAGLVRGELRRLLPSSKTVTNVPNPTGGGGGTGVIRNASRYLSLYSGSQKEVCNEA